MAYCDGEYGQLDTHFIVSSPKNGGKICPHYIDQIHRTYFEIQKQLWIWQKFYNVDSGKDSESTS